MIWIKQNYKLKQMDIFYGTQFSKNYVHEMIKQSEDIIRTKQIQKEGLPKKINQQVNYMLFQKIECVYQNSQQKPLVGGPSQQICNIKIDNRTPLKLKFEKKSVQQIPQRINFDVQSYRKSSSVKSKRDQRTASTNNRKKLVILNRTFDGSFLQQMPMNQSQCRRRCPRTVQVSSRKKYLQLKEQRTIVSQDDQQNRKQLKQKRYLERVQQQRTQHAILKSSYRKKALQQQFQAAKIGQKGSTFGKGKQVNQITNCQVQNGSLLTNRLRKPYKKTIQNIVNLEYVDRVKENILRGKGQNQFFIGRDGKSKVQNLQSGQQQKFNVGNYNYNNGGRRQTSLIPYVTMTPGVCLSERSIQASISRARPSQQLSRQKFFSTIQTNAFRSHSKDYSPQKSVDRKHRTIQVCQYNRASKSTLNNQTKDSLKKSILWGFKTSMEGNSIKLGKKDLLKQLTSQHSYG